MRRLLNSAQSGHFARRLAKCRKLFSENSSSKNLCRYVKVLKKDPDCALQYLKTHNDICAKTASIRSKIECPQDFIIANLSLSKENPSIYQAPVPQSKKAFWISLKN